MTSSPEFTDALASIQADVAAINSHIRATSPPPQPASQSNEVLAALDALRKELLIPRTSPRNDPGIEVPQTWVQRSSGPNPVIQSFEQEEDILTIISDTLQRYPIKSTFKEYLANAEDSGGATNISWLLDRTQHPSRKLISQELAECQGPALACFNDGGK